MHLDLILYPYLLAPLPLSAVQNYEHINHQHREDRHHIVRVMGGCQNKVLQFPKILIDVVALGANRRDLIRLVRLANLSEDSGALKLASVRVAINHD